MRTDRAWNGACGWAIPAGSRTLRLAAIIREGTGSARADLGSHGDGSWKGQPEVARDHALIGCIGKIIVATRGQAGPGEVMVSVRGGREALIAWSAEPLAKGSRGEPPVRAAQAWTSRRCCRACRPKQLQG